MAEKKIRDVEKQYSVNQKAAKLRRLADCLEKGKPFQIQISGERISVPARTVFNSSYSILFFRFHPFSLRQKPVFGVLVKTLI